MSTPRSPHHVVVWLDQHEARVFRVEDSGFEESTTHSRHPHGSGRAVESNHPDDAKRFFHEVARALDPADEVLVAGPSLAKIHFMKYVKAHEPKLMNRIVGVETLDHPTDGQLAAVARRYFQDVDRMRGVAP